MKYTLVALFITVSLTLFSCNKGVDSPRGFSLPKGSVAAGEKVFLKFQCLACHRINNVEDASIEKNESLSIFLGGNKTEIVTYAELVTSVINPSHKFSNPALTQAKTADGQSKMKIFNDEMTVTELIDLVTFLQPNYTLVPYRHTKYQYYPQQ
ncbi:c-type cytochrome [Colwellia sp. BRX10-3]|uniref:c-type cytochrome n=1 Tax=Colwellia sp. BRX10-3 TaxID=2759844 RepID=UPI0015F73A28|nr:c-type cytochrome [Colwellia sp. BRX10-3]MBA6390927.1 c-type cytochrome [Colwellia sp. BRX10-3]